MMSPKARLIVAAGLFVAWLGWLVYLVTQTRDPVILSRPQFLVAQLYVTAHLTAEDDKPAAKVKIEQTLWAREEKDKLAAGAEVMVPNLRDCGAEQGWRGNGVYVLPLLKSELKDTYMIALIPQSPGFAADKAHRLRIYPANEEALRQVQEIIGKNDEVAVRR